MIDSLIESINRLESIRSHLVSINDAKAAEIEDIIIFLQERLTETINLDYIERSVALISDTHVMSDIALVPRVPIYDRAGNDVTAGISQGLQKIQSYWYDQWIPTCEKFKVDTVMHFGDACQGCNPKESGIDTLTADIDLQKDSFVELMKPLVRDRNYHQFTGTQYHEALNVRIHKDLTEKLSPFCKKAHFHGKFANVKFTSTSKIANCAHAATSAQIYPATVIDREITFVKVAAAEGRVPKPNYLIRGHLHRYLHLDYPDIHGIQLPGWMAWYPLGDKVRLYGRTQPDIGGVILLIDKEDRTILMHFIYPTPNILGFLKEA